MWVQCFAQGQISRGIEGGESIVCSLPHLQLLDYESDSLTTTFIANHVTDLMSINLIIC